MPDELPKLTVCAHTLRWPAHDSNLEYGVAHSAALYSGSYQHYCLKVELNTATICTISWLPPVKPSPSGSYIVEFLTRSNGNQEINFTPVHAKVTRVPEKARSPQQHNSKFRSVFKQSTKLAKSRNKTSTAHWLKTPKIRPSLNWTTAV